MENNVNVEQNQENTEQRPRKHYKIEVGDVVTVLRTDVDKWTFYKVSIPKKQKDGTVKFFQKNIAFNSGIDIKDKTKIRILDFFEDVFSREGDKYNANWTLHILDYEIVSNPATDDVLEYHNEVKNIENGNIIINDDDLPF